VLVPFPHAGFLKASKTPDKEFCFWTQGVTFFRSKRKMDFGFKGTWGHNFSKSYEKKKKAKCLSRTQPECVILLAAIIHLDVGKLNGSPQVVSADPLTWWILKIIHFSVLDHISTNTIKC
jgi:hypothetical protein